MIKLSLVDLRDIQRNRQENRPLSARWVLADDMKANSYGIPLPRAPVGNVYTLGRPSTRSAYHPNCATPIRAGDPGYRAGLARDGDGVACE